MNRAIVLSTLSVFLATACANTARTTPPPPAQELTDGRPTVDALIADFVAAISANDKAALNRLRLNEAEYRSILVPGTVKPGAPPRVVSQQSSVFFWQLLDEKSRIYADQLLRDFGGRPYRHWELKFTGPPQQFAWYSTVGEVRLELQGEDDKTWHLETGSIAEVGDRFKFIGFNYD